MTDTEIAETQTRTSLSAVGFVDTGSGHNLTPANLSEVVSFSNMMAKAGKAIPIHFREQPGACMRVVLQAMKWGMDPFAVADKTYIVNDRLAYEAQLVAAVIISRSGITGRPQYEFSGQGPTRRCAVTCIFKDGTAASYESPEIGAIKVKNSPLWQADPDQQLGYYAMRAWARRHAPEIIMGVYDREEVESIGPDNARDITPASSQRYVKRADIEHDQTRSSELTPRGSDASGAASTPSPEDAAPILTDEEQHRVAEYARVLHEAWRDQHGQPPEIQTKAIERASVAWLFEQKDIPAHLSMKMATTLQRVLWAVTEGFDPPDRTDD